MADDNSIKTGNISNSFIGRIGHDFHGPKQRKIDDPLRKQISQQMPRNKPIAVTSVMGDGEAGQFAVEIYGYLQAQGFQMAESGPGQAVFNVPVKGLHVHDAGTVVNFTVGHA